MRSLIDMDIYGISEEEFAFLTTKIQKLEDFQRLSFIKSFSLNEEEISNLWSFWESFKQSPSEENLYCFFQHLSNFNFERKSDALLRNTNNIDRKKMNDLISNDNDYVIFEIITFLRQLKYHEEFFDQDIFKNVEMNNKYRYQSFFSIDGEKLIKELWNLNRSSYKSFAAIDLMLGIIDNFLNLRIGSAYLFLINRVENSASHKVGSNVYHSIKEAMEYKEIKENNIDKLATFRKVNFKNQQNQFISSLINKNLIKMACQGLEIKAAKETVLGILDFAKIKSFEKKTMYDLWDLLILNPKKLDKSEKQIKARLLLPIFEILFPNWFIETDKGYTYGSENDRKIKYILSRVQSKYQ